MKMQPHDEIILKGTPLSPGAAVAPVCIFNDTRGKDIPKFNINIDDIDYEKDRVRNAFAASEKSINKVKNESSARLSEEELGIFDVHLMILKDSSLVKKINKIIEVRHMNAEAAVAEVFEQYEQTLSLSENDYMKERADDISALKTRVHGALSSFEPSFSCTNYKGCTRGKNRIVVTEELTPHLTMEMEGQGVIGLIAEHGGKTSHAAILARAVGIPAVSGLPGIHSMIPCGVKVVVDGTLGEVIINPSLKTLARFEGLSNAKYHLPDRVAPVEGLRIMANISLSSDVDGAVEMSAEGVGLYRTEFEFIGAGRSLNEDEQVEKYSYVLKKLDGRPAYFRMLDLGSDKQYPSQNSLYEENPALGLRGARFLEAEKDLFNTQARALARASSFGKVHVMLPMIVSAAQFVRMRDAFKEAVSDIKNSNLLYGVMFEVPSACYEAEDLLREADFGSIGTNDLIQYFFAVDRNNDLVSYDYTPETEVFKKLLISLKKAADKYSKPLSICGEMAGEEKYLELILQTRIDAVSVSPRLIPAIRTAYNKLKGD